MLKLRLFITMLLVALFTPFLSACDGDPNHVYVQVVSFDSSSKMVNMAVNGTAQLKYNIVPFEATDKSVSFSSDNTAVVTVSSEGLVTAKGAGRANITIKALDNDYVQADTCIVNVRQDRQTLTAPQNVAYNSATGLISWDAVNTVNNGDTSFLPSYQLSLIKGSEAEQTIITSSTSYSAIEKGSVYTVKVKTLGNSALYDDSYYGTPLTFAQLGSPSSLSLNLTGANNQETARNTQFTFKLSNLANSITDYDFAITKNNAQLSVYENNLWNSAIANGTIVNGIAYIDIPTDLSIGKYSIKIAAKANVATNYFASSFGETFNITQLATPTNISLGSTATAKQLTWASVTGASGYKVILKYHINDTIQTIVDYVAGSTMLLLNQEGTPSRFDSVQVFLYAMGNEISTLDSKISDGQATVQLAPVDVESIMVSCNTELSRYDISWDAVPNAGSYKVYLCDKNSTEVQSSERLIVTTSTPNASLAFYRADNNSAQLWHVGDNYLKIIVDPEANSNFLQSEAVYHTWKFIKLGNPTNFRMSEGVLHWDIVENANSYNLVINNKTYTVETQPAVTSLSFEFSGSDFEAGQAYEIFMYALNNEDDYTVRGEFSSVGAMITKLVAPTNVQVANGILKWTASTSSNKYMIEVSTGADVNSSTIIGTLGVTAAEYDMATYLQNQNYVSQGNYLFFRVKTMGDNNQYANSDYTAPISTYQIPTIQNLRVQDGIISWDAIDDELIAPNHRGITFQVNIAGALYTDISDTHYLVSGLAGSNSYQVRVRAVIEGGTPDGVTTNQENSNIYLINSSFTETINVVQLSAARNVKMVANLLQWSAVNYGTVAIENYKVVLDLGGENENSFVVNNSTQFEITSQLLSEGEHTVHVYALSNPESNQLNSYKSNSVNLYKLPKPEIRISNGLLTWRPVVSQLDGTSTIITKYSIYVTDGTNEQYFDSDGIYTTALTGLNLDLLGRDITLQVTALSSTTRLYQSEPSNALGSTENNRIRKLNPVDMINSFMVVGNNIKWNGSTDQDGSNNVTYRIQVSKRDMSGNSSIIGTQTINGVCNWDIPDSFTAGVYTIQIMRKGFVDGNMRYIDCDYKDTCTFQRLAQPTGLCIDRSQSNHATLRWTGEDLNGSDTEYKVTIKVNGANAEPIVVNTQNNYLDLVTEVNGIVPGTLEFKVQTVLQNNTPNTGPTYIISSSESATINATQFVSPTFDIKNGVMSWNNSNPDNNGIMVRFTRVLENAGTYSISTEPTDIKTFEFNNNKTTFDMVDDWFVDDEAYYVEIMARGNKLNQIESSYKGCTNFVTRLSPLNTNTINTNVTQDFNGWYVENGALCWKKITGVSEYVINASNTANSYTFNISNGMGGESFCEQLDLEYTEYGWDISFNLIGDNTNDFIEINSVKYTRAYVSSAEGNTVNLIKLANPTNSSANAYLRVQNGEIDWGTRDVDGNWVPAEGETQYHIRLLDSDEPNYNCYFDLSTVEGRAGRYIMSEQNFDDIKPSIDVRAMGTSFWNGVSADTVYLNSPFSNIIYVQNFAMLDDLVIDDGIITWNADAKGEDIIGHAYDLEMTYVDNENVTQTFTTRVTKATTNIADLITDYNYFESIRVRHSGHNKSEPGASACVNSKWSLPLTNVLKMYNFVQLGGDFGDKQLAINELGYVEWNYGQAYVDAIEAGLFDDFNIKLKISVELCYTEAGTSNIVTLQTSIQYIDYPTTMFAVQSIPNTNDNVRTYYRITIYAMGTDAFNTSSSGIGYLNSEPITLIASQMKPATSFTLGPELGLRLLWDVTASDILVHDITTGNMKELKADKLLITYKVNDEQPWSFRVITFVPDSIDEATGEWSLSGNLRIKDARGEANKNYNELTWIESSLKVPSFTQCPIWMVGNITSARLSVLTSTGEALASDVLTPKDAENRILDSIDFNKFVAGNGTRVSPFQVTDVTQLGHIYGLSELYFTLNNDIALTDLATMQATDATRKNNWPTHDPASAYIFTGGLDGNGYSITNFQSNGDIVVGMWETIIGTTLPTQYDDLNNIIPDNYNYKSGIIQDLILEVSYLNLSSLTAAANGILTNVNLGNIIGCTVRGAEVEDLEGNLIPVVVGEVTIASKSYFGALVGQNGAIRTQIINPDSTVITSYVDGKGYIADSVNLLNISYKASNASDTVLGGIAGRNYAGTILNCTNGASGVVPNAVNGGTLNALILGGIAGENESIHDDDVGADGTHIEAVISGCVNYGNITTTVRVANATSPVGGIAGQNLAGYITFCINHGHITANSQLPATNATGLAGSVGGIIGWQDAGYMTNCVSLGVVDYDGETLQTSILGALLGYNNAITGNSWFAPNYCGIATAVGEGNVYSSNTILGHNYLEPTMPATDPEYFLSLINTTTFVLTDDTTTVNVAFARHDGKYAQFVKIANDRDGGNVIFNAPSITYVTLG